MIWQRRTHAPSVGRGGTRSRAGCLPGRCPTGPTPAAPRNTARTVHAWRRKAHRAKARKREQPGAGVWPSAGLCLTVAHGIHGARHALGSCVLSHGGGRAALCTRKAVAWQQHAALDGGAAPTPPPAGRAVSPSNTVPPTGPPWHHGQGATSLLLPPHFSLVTRCPLPRNAPQPRPPLLPLSAVQPPHAPCTPPSQAPARPAAQSPIHPPSERPALQLPPAVAP